MSNFSTISITLIQKILVLKSITLGGFFSTVDSKFSGNPGFRSKQLSSHCHNARNFFFEIVENLEGKTESPRVRRIRLPLEGKTDPSNPQD